MPVTLRRYQAENDYWLIRAFLREVFLLNGRRDLSWQVARLDYWRWHGIENCGACESVDAVTFLWETIDGEIAAVLNTEDLGEVYLQVHPAYSTPKLEAEMIAAAEAYLSAPTADGHRRVRIWAHADDTLRQSLLTGCGYARDPWPEYQRQRLLDQPIPEAPLPDGYQVRALGDCDELPARSWASWRAFHPDEPDASYGGWHWYRNIQRMPLYRRDLDVVAIDAAGVIVGFCTVWYDDVTRTGCFEPVGIMPEHQGRGLGKALMCEGLRRLARLGGTLATVAGYSPEANALYSAVMSPHYAVNEAWRREFD